MNHIIDWTVLELPGVEALCRRVALRVKQDAAVPGRLADHADLWQTARELAAGVRVLAPQKGPTGMAARVRELHAQEDMGRMHRELSCDLMNAVYTQVGHVRRTSSFEERHDEPADDAVSWTPHTAPPVTTTPPGDYDLATVRRLIPGVFDPLFAWGVQMENAPDADMPRGTVNRATGGTFAAMLADIKIAWARAPLTMGERRAVFLVLGLGWRQVEAAYNQRVDQATISRRVSLAAAKLLSELVGAPARAGNGLVRLDGQVAA